MHRDLLSLVFLRLNQTEQVRLSRCSAFIFRSPLTTVIKLIGVEELTQQILEKKSLSNKFLWEGLRVLNLEDNKKIMNIPLTVAGTLEELNASWDCGLSDLALASLTKLKKLNVHNNKNIKTISLEIASTLEELDARGLCGLDNEGIKQVSKLRKLNVENNPNITTIPLKVADTLEELDASWSCGLRDSDLAGLTKLRILNARYNYKFKTIPLTVAATLEELDVRGSFFDDSTLALASLKNLRKFNVTKSSIV